MPVFLSKEQLFKKIKLLKRKIISFIYLAIISCAIFFKEEFLSISFFNKLLPSSLLLIFSNKELFLKLSDPDDLFCVTVSSKIEKYLNISFWSVINFFSIKLLRAK